MDYIDRENLNERIKRNGPLTEAKAVEYICKVGDALDYIHSRNMNNFDVKPVNIMVRQSDVHDPYRHWSQSCMKLYGCNIDSDAWCRHGYSTIELYNPGNLLLFSLEKIF